MRRGANLPSLGGYNQRVVLDAIRRRPGGISRVEVAQATGLSAQTITNVTRRLLDAGLVREGRVEVQGPGKPRTMLVARADALYAVGVHVDPALLHGVVLDLGGETRAAFTTASPQEFGPAQAVPEIARLVTGMLDDAGITASRVAGLGLAVPGPLRDGVMVDPPLLPQWWNTDLRARLDAVTPWPVLIEKDVIASARGEMWMRREPASDSFGYLYLGSGVGFGAVVRGEVSRGVTGNFGDLGHLLVAGAEGGRPDVLGSLLLPSTIIEQAIASGAWRGAVPTTAAGVDEQFRAVCQAASDARIEAVLGGVGDALGSAAVVVSDLLDLDELVMGGPYWPLIAPAARPRLERALADRTVLGSVRPVRLLDAVSPHRAEGVGAAALVLDQVVSASPRYLVAGAPETAPLPL